MGHKTSDNILFVAFSFTIVSACFISLKQLQRQRFDFRLFYTYFHMKQKNIYET